MSFFTLFLYFMLSFNEQFLIFNVVKCIHFFSFYINLFIFLFLAALGLRCCARAFSSCGKLGLLFLVVCGLLTAVASLVVEDGL